MSAIYEKARAIAEAAANGWDKFSDTASINWLTDAIMEFGATPRDDGRCMCEACKAARLRAQQRLRTSPDECAFCTCKIGQCQFLTERCREMQP